MHVALSAITVRFGALTAVDDVSLAIAPGEIHAIVGENGAGKSTLMNVLFGLVEPLAGTISIDGAVRQWKSPQGAIAAGLGMVHQHFMLQEEMTVLENIVLCSEPVGHLGFVNFAAARRRLMESAEGHGIAIGLDRVVGDLSVGERQVVEILKVLYREAEVLILDEPTSVLTPQEKDRLFAILKSFRAAGKAIVLITHKLDEVMDIADRVSVMRGGRLIASGPLAETSKKEIARGIIGGELPSARQSQSRAPGDVVLSVDKLVAAGRGMTVGPITLSVRAGEIVGIAGVSGNGQAELVQALTGLKVPASGAITLCGIRIEALDVERRRQIAMSYIPEDRQRVGLALGATVAENANAGRDDRAAFSRGPFLNRPAMARFARSLIERYRIRVGGPSARVSTMSGGKQAEACCRSRTCPCDAAGRRRESDMGRRYRRDRLHPWRIDAHARRGTRRAARLHRTRRDSGPVRPHPGHVRRPVWRGGRRRSQPRADRRPDDLTRDRRAAGGRMNAGLKGLLRGELVSWLGVAASVAVLLLLLMALAGAPFAQALSGFVDGAFGGRRFSYLLTTLSRTALVVGMAISVMLSFRAGLFNIGGEGQLVAGGLVAALVAILLPGPPLVVLIVAIVAAMAAGALWALLAGVLQLHLGVPLLVGSLLLNYPIRYMGSFLVAHPFRDVESGMVQSHLVPQTTWLPYFPGTRLDIGILFIAVASIFAIVYSHATVHGYHARLNGLSADFARAVGLPVKRLALQTLAMSGAIAGLVGAIAVFGIHHRYIDGMLVQPLYAWTGIIAVLLVGMIPWLVPLSGFFFAAIQTGAAGMERTADPEGNRTGHAGGHHSLRRKPRVGRTACLLQSQGRRRRRCLSSSSTARS